MGWCKLGKIEGAAAVADLVMFNTTLHSLDVRGNGFEDNGAILLSRALKEHSNEHLKELDLGYNEIKDDGACQVALVSFLLIMDWMQISFCFCSRTSESSIAHVLGV